VNGGLLYLDSSAIVKFVLAEPETDALVEFLRGWPERISSVLARLEVLRVVRRAGVREAAYRRAEGVVARIGLVGIDEAVVRLAEDLEPQDLRTPEAIHLATALSVGEELGCLISYDARLSRAATSSGMLVLSPGKGG
jgi:predicted nucleic acid-binding protein